MCTRTSYIWSKDGVPLRIIFSMIDWAAWIGFAAGWYLESSLQILSSNCIPDYIRFVKQFTNSVLILHLDIWFNIAFSAYFLEETIYIYVDVLYRCSLYASIFWQYFKRIKSTEAVEFIFDNVMYSQIDIVAMCITLVQVLKIFLWAFMKIVWKCSKTNNALSICGWCDEQEAVRFFVQLEVYTALKGYHGKGEWLLFNFSGCTFWNIWTYIFYNCVSLT